MISLSTIPPAPHTFLLASEAALHIDGPIGMCVAGGSRQALTVDSKCHWGRMGALKAVASIGVCTLYLSAGSPTFCLTMGA